MKKLTIIAAVGALALPLVTQAAVINFDVTREATGSEYTGTAIAPDAGTVWNQILVPHWDDPGPESITVSSVTDSVGTALPGVSLSLVTSGHPIYVWDEDESSAPANPVDLMSDYTFLGDYTVTLSGLTPGSYDFWYYGHGDQTNQTGTITFDAANGGASGSPANSVLGRDLVNGGDGVSYNYFNAVTVPGSGELTFVVNDQLNGFQMEGIPEPATIGLVGIFGGGLLLLRRNFKR